VHSTQVTLNSYLFKLADSQLGLDYS